MGRDREGTGAVSTAIQSWLIVTYIASCPWQVMCQKKNKCSQLESLLAAKVNWPMCRPQICTASSPLAVLFSSAGWIYILWSNIRPLLHQTSPIMPETVMKREHVLKFFWFIHTGMRVLPLIGGESETKPNLETRAQSNVISGLSKVWCILSRRFPPSRTLVSKRLRNFFVFCLLLFLLHLISFLIVVAWGFDFQSGKTVGTALCFH